MKIVVDSTLGDGAVAVAQPPASWNARRRVPSGGKSLKSVAAGYSAKKSACRCRDLGEYFDPDALSGSNSPLVRVSFEGLEDLFGDLGEFGSWLSSTFKKVTGQKLSDVVGGAASTIPFVGPVIAGAVAGKSNSQPSQGASLVIPSGQSASDPLSKLAAQVRSVLQKVSDVTRAAAGPSQAEREIERRAQQAELKADQQRTLLYVVGGAAGLAVVAALMRK